MNVLISLDGISYQSFEPYAQQWIENGYSFCQKLITTFPSVTFTAHAAAMTGSHPGKHGVFDNIVARPETMERVALYGDHEILCNEALHKQTIFHSLARQAGTSCCIHWPMTSGNPYIHHLITESGSKKKLKSKVSVEEIDHVALRETMRAIKTEAYDFISARFVGYDALSHQYGKDSPEAMRCLKELLTYLDQIEQTLKKTQKPFNLIIFSDHGQSDIHSFFYPNEILAKSQWKQHFRNKQIKFVGDGSGALLFYSSLDYQQNKEIMAFFEQMPEVHHFYELTGDTPSACSPFGILDLKHTVCGEDIAFPEQPKYQEMKSLHGYHPANVDEMNGFLLCLGDAFTKSKMIEETNIENIAPTLAQLFRIAHPCDGQPIKDIFKEYE
ncbi:alkaline phosphatase family protein [Brevibacillus porteri]|uniref:AP protein n=1 Tax=Brevibacillus porteri TaxID=2126350 RepID=A0ABX5FNG1_9BACL|nr:alkaline phosphatase family protein [Brevibacillus porteri]MED1802049.1 alkaline phosphatase family protein [Brevibacillus porteri]MED2133577.1 alkaline phosphatase family protein [Brevibacillus porteri]MED2747887.1 alkaline phosphatase family protein [Brevibacillus porteri]MED2813133.1 alkaline phosphatase family protein [Brevibacillus porteri]MED2892502.1 alkaline phosphatase family protein [Brevibacillus porteri]